MSNEVPERIDLTKGPPVVYEWTGTDKWIVMDWDDYWEIREADELDLMEIDYYMLYGD